MIRNARALAFVLAAVVVLSGAAAPAASAQSGMLTSDGPVTLTGTQTGEGVNAITAFGSKTQCPKATYTGHRYNVTPHELIENGSTTVTITPHFGECTTSNVIALPTTIDMNGCDYVFHFETTIGVDRYAVLMTVICPAGKHITLTMFTSATNHLKLEPFCHVTITENSIGYTGLSVVDTTNGRLDVSGATIENVVADKASPTGSILCPGESTVNGKIDLDLQFEGRDFFGKSTAISLSHS